MEISSWSSDRGAGSVIWFGDPLLFAKGAIYGWVRWVSGSTSLTILFARHERSQVTPRNNDNGQRVAIRIRALRQIQYVSTAHGLTAART